MSKPTHTPSSNAEVGSNNAATSLKPFPAEATQRILECPHILEAILKYSSRSTQRACLLSSRSLFESSGRVLYRNVYIGGRAGDSLELFFRGALIGTGFGHEDMELAKCPLNNGHPECKIHSPNDNHFNFNDDESDNSSHSSEDETIAQPITFPVSATSTTSTKAKTSKLNDGHPNKEERDREGASVDSDKAEGVPCTTNFKLALLKHVRVLTISTHHACNCHIYGPHIKHLLPHLEVVRVASDFFKNFELLRLCDAEVCMLLTNVKCHKLVLRNLDGNGLPLEPFFCLGNGDSFPICQELVVFLTMDGRRLVSDFENMTYWHDRSLLELGHCFPNAPDVKIVFYPTWEGWDESDDVLAFIHGHVPVTPDDIVYGIKDFLQYAHPQYTIYGMGKLRWYPDGDLIGVFMRFFPDTKLTRRAILDLVRHELRTGSLFLAIGDDNIEYDPGYPERITYKTFNEYLKDEGGRLYELTADC
ncbi:hypothetical protein CcaverHIS002_0111600 [Cutaneotrichosporon cavernicola]|uniref:Uncharacterized protein n=1 Tax=Cutaneotrichosporon cavernicola TaxID=279322 RepID=A0AA48L164_9TREE|nr:uncharacterized protein CcaverHIS019_0111500 [Cutaneotrichosporon cavernicola]BEI80631.1 hypothetical protein CcaverHIS002_0111600 [Cutaneotrichosporon cavernicola]BEI88432.1 hypothetical protein CcaverHIS019_0111500 [Cutaneotrichosporon cavernicola]BEI96205.1 hypothetical protein CcaverHIS631_0111540 [Cutaneotrichosporon cavernicola]BEJ03976.1 hypothetical protein CcaverHIS641_0111510 [Cutaneotrichosporon cavernicola]